MGDNKCISCNEKIDPRSTRCHSCATKEQAKNRPSEVNEKIKATLIKKGISPPITHRFGKENPFYGKKHSEETKEIIRQKRKLQAPSRLGKKHTKETKEKISLSRIGKCCEEKHYLWKGDNAGYGAIHGWIKRVLGRPNKCEKCGLESDNKNMIQWANKDHKYKRDISDWMRLCAKCHTHYDIKFNNKLIKKHV